MRTSSFLLVAAGLAALAGCVKNTEAPPLSGPSTLATSIVMTAARDSIIQNGVDSTTIAIQALGPDGQSKTVTLRAEIFVNGVAVDFGRLSSKAPVTPTTITYFSPPAPLESVGSGTRVMIAVTPVGGDFAGEIKRSIEINVIPPGVILPPNGAPVPLFSVAPSAPITRQTVTFDASASTDEGVLCLSRCTYAWNFGDSTTGSGLTTTHDYRTAGTYSVTLTVTDDRSTSAVLTQSLVVAATSPPTVSFLISPTPVGVTQDVFFDGGASRAATGRSIVGYAWSFGDGRTASGVTAVHSYTNVGTYQVILKVTDDVDAVGQASQGLTVGATGSGPVATMTVLPTAPKVGGTVTFNASASTTNNATITNYAFDYGDGSPIENSTVPVQSHKYGAAGTVVAKLTITDSLGRKASFTVSVTIVP